MNNKISFFLDSGAFSAWSKGIKIDLQDYIYFIKENQSLIDTYAVLDDIQNPEITLQNQKIMEDAGLNPLPCYHYGEDIKYLNQYLKKYSYIAFGGMVPIGNKELISWLDNLFSKYICDSKGIPKVKVHGFGLTAFDLMLRYPWYSVDSTSWVMNSRFGGFYMPAFKNGKFNYLAGQLKINISEKSPSLNKFDANYFTMPKEKQKIIEQFVSLMECDIKKLSEDYHERDKINIKYFMELEKAIPEYPRKFEYMNNGSLF